MKKDVLITEVALRDGSHAVSHQFTINQVETIVEHLDKANVPYIEVAHGDGLGGSSLQYGRSKVDEMKLIEAAVAKSHNSKIATLLLPGIGTKKHLQQARELGVHMARVATHVTEADVSAQHINLAKEMDMETVGFLMMAHMVPTTKLVEQAKLMESYGADIVYVVDSAGALLPHQVKERIKALKEELGVEIGFHGHNNLSVAMGNTIEAIHAGASRIDGSIRCLGAGAGNTQTEVLIGVLEKLGISTGVDMYKIMDVAEYQVAPLLPKPQEITKDSLAMGYAGVYSSFLLHARRAAEKYNVDTRDILVKLGELKAVGGQEDMIVDIAQEMAKNENPMHI
ncbi:4-hydroxy-2-oxovalerate aldolase [Alteribacillus persepolensis]|uniref:4-hydroxy-2-oxovalerate aldolase n=1 Tax=Alteribacillus persepolensis TaxID=568899 RepID=A0A1G8EDP9_9BACI|nr:4-hydroxy-2-oxovalerate aldolase [Alteribacillus persepolensis]SDH67994.1 4-hydroxy-2-oxovalerate aldolase [Alteribacillus persepolensis]